MSCAPVVTGGSVRSAGRDERVALTGIADIHRGRPHPDGPVAGRRRVDEHHLDVVAVSAAPPVVDTPAAKTLPRNSWAPPGDNDLEVEVVDDRGRRIGRARRLGPDEGDLQRLRVARDVDVMLVSLAGGQTLGVAEVPDAR